MPDLGHLALNIRHVHAWLRRCHVRVFSYLTAYGAVGSWQSQICAKPTEQNYALPVPTALYPPPINVRFDPQVNVRRLLLGRIQPVNRQATDH
jgi:hypothetical protein